MREREEEERAREKECKLSDRQVNFQGRSQYADVTAQTDREREKRTDGVKNIL